MKKNITEVMNSLKNSSADWEGLHIRLDSKAILHTILHSHNLD